MISWLIKRLVRNHDKADDPKVRGAYGKMTAGLGIACNLLLALGKFLVGSVSGSVSILADAANNLSDASSGVISLLGFKLAGKPPDPEHPYGHARYEYLAGLGVAVIIMIIGAELLKSGVDRALHPAPVLFSWLSAGVLTASILVKLWMMLLYKRVAGIIGSQTLTAASQDSRNDVIATAAVLFAALVSEFAGLKLDGYIGILVALFILYSGWGLIRDTLDPLLGKAPDAELVRGIREAIMGYPGVLGTHDLMIHDYGPGRRFASVHVEMAAEEDPMRSHDVIDNIERDMLISQHLHMIVHLDPIVTQDADLLDLRHWLSAQVKAIHPELSLHDLRLVKGVTHSNVIFDCIKPAGLAMSDTHLKERITAIVQAEYPSYYCVITVDQSYAAIPG